MAARWRSESNSGNEGLVHRFWKFDCATEEGCDLAAHASELFRRAVTDRGECQRAFVAATNESFCDNEVGLPGQFG